MTAHAVSSPSSVAAAAQSAARSAPQDAAAMPFGQQLHAARKDQTAASQPRASTHDAPPRRVPDRSNDSRPRDPASVRAHDAGPNRADQRDNAASSDPTADSSSNPAAASGIAAAAVATAPAPVIVTVGASAADEAMPADSATDGEDQGGTALVGAMLALIGPSMVKTSAPGTASGSAAGKLAAPAPATTAPLSAATTGASGADAEALSRFVMAATDGVSVPAPVVTPGPIAPVVVDVTKVNGGAPADNVVMSANDGLAARAVPFPQLPGAELKAALRDTLDPTLPDAAAARPVASLAAPAIGVPTGPVCVPVIAPAGTQAFTRELGQHVAWFVSHDIKEARIRLHPEELGSLDLKISVSHGRVDVNFQAQHPGAVLAVQQSLPQLEQMLAQHGLSLGNTEVGQQHERGDQRGQGRADTAVSDTAEIHATRVVTPLGQLGLVDAFA